MSGTQDPSQSCQQESQSLDQSVEITTEQLTEANNNLQQAVRLINGDMVPAAIDLLTHVLDVYLAKYGVTALECAPVFFRYGQALLFRAQDAPKESNVNNTMVTNTDDEYLYDSEEDDESTSCEEENDGVQETTNDENTPVVEKEAQKPQLSETITITDAGQDFGVKPDKKQTQSELLDMNENINGSENATNLDNKDTKENTLQNTGEAPKELVAIDIKCRGNSEVQINNNDNDSDVKEAAEKVVGVTDSNKLADVNLETKEVTFDEKQSDDIVNQDSNKDTEVAGVKLVEAGTEDIGQKVIEENEIEAVQKLAGEGTPEEQEEEEELTVVEADLSTAWEYLETARHIYEQSGIEKYRTELAEIMSCLGDVSTEREDFETAIEDLKKSLEYFKHVTDKQHKGSDGKDDMSALSLKLRRRIAETHFKLALVMRFTVRYAEANEEADAAIGSLLQLQSELEGSDMVEQDVKTKNLADIQGSITDLKEFQNEVKELAKAGGIARIKSAIEAAQKIANNQSANDEDSEQVVADTNVAETSSTQLLKDLPMDNDNKNKLEVDEDAQGQESERNDLKKQEAEYEQDLSVNYLQVDKNEDQAKGETGNATSMDQKENKGHSSISCGDKSANVKRVYDEVEDTLDVKEDGTIKRKKQKVLLEAKQNNNTIQNI
eukprot:TRINITY_DN17134_c0_g1_i4.p1 TRINITY_DN17134_c0_g1~~TRINITY_DN17134_c0_g1_i4.p1  ORF type:complete len:665 (-),score=137.06 TRINITY_DN17134_c0_g1_i4:1167-3161(-)